MELIQVQQNEIMIPDAQVVSVPVEDNNGSSFIESNTRAVTLEHLKKDTIFPSFSDSEAIISHPEFIESTQNAILKAFPNIRQTSTDIRVSHIVNGRVSTAAGKSVKELLPHERTIYYSRVAFFIQIPEIQHNVNGNMVNLVAGGVRSYSNENLYSKKSIEKFQVFIGFKNQVCTNLIISTDGFKEEIRVTSAGQLQERMEELFLSYDQDKNLGNLERLDKFSLNREQFAHLIGKLKIYQHSGSGVRKNLFQVSFNDSMINAVSKSYFQDDNFRVGEDGSINLWNLYNLFTGAIKSSYIDSFLKRECQAFEFNQMLANAMQNREENYFLIP